MRGTRRDPVKENSIMMRTGVMVAAMGLAVASANAQDFHEGDIPLSIHNNQVVVGPADVATGVQEPGSRVFIVELGALVPGFANDPGYDHSSGLFSETTQNGFTIRTALRKWDGSDFDDIAVERLEFRKGALSPIATPIDDTPTPGFDITVGSDERWHEHFGMLLLSPASNGVYMVELELTTNEPGVADSLPYWLVFDQNASQVDVDAASVWIVDNLESPDPSCNPADLNTATAPSPAFAGWGVPDGVLTPTDFSAFAAFFQTGDLRADLNDASAPSPAFPAWAQPDGLLTPTDFSAFAFFFTQPCG